MRSGRRQASPATATACPNLTDRYASFVSPVPRDGAHRERSAHCQRFADAQFQIWEIFARCECGGPRLTHRNESGKRQQKEGSELRLVLHPQQLGHPPIDDLLLSFLSLVNRVAEPLQFFFQTLEFEQSPLLPRFEVLGDGLFQLLLNRLALVLGGLPVLDGQLLALPVQAVIRLEQLVHFRIVLFERRPVAVGPAGWTELGSGTRRRADPADPATRIAGPEAVRCRRPIEGPLSRTTLARLTARPFPGFSAGMKTRRHAGSLSRKSAGTTEVLRAARPTVVDAIGDGTARVVGPGGTLEASYVAAGFEGSAAVTGIAPDGSITRT